MISLATELISWIDFCKFSERSTFAEERKSCTLDKRSSEYKLYFADLAKRPDEPHFSYYVFVLLWNLFFQFNFLKYKICSHIEYVENLYSEILSIIPQIRNLEDLLAYLHLFESPIQLDVLYD